ncbi:alpha/beta hydrolase [Bacillus sp. H-16]|uniref:alpha/beta hydrolase n=1 Tax=Alteribacter salitolerans TaxID=2912333 RepID=UPI001962E12B|nr:alpha/beta hydrolase [Alteribacter salitolerans]MBM7097979.1 alpha/beta hydrolase [Alteribacter salitolerans]
MKVKNGNVKTKSGKIPYSLMKHEKDAGRVAIVLPGAAYTAQGPLLYYATSILFRNGFDILHINYEYTREELSGLTEEGFTADVRNVIDEVIGGAPYEEIIAVAKSVGTIALSYLMEEERFARVKAIWLTPLIQRDDVYKSLSGSWHPGLCVIGDRDPVFERERFSEIDRNPRIQGILVKDANHALELEGDVMGSLDVLKNIMAGISGWVANR